MQDSSNPVAAAVQAVKGQTEPVTPAEPASKPETNQEFDVWARKEKQMRAQQRKLSEERDALKARITEYETGYIPKSRLASDPWSVLSEAGLTQEQLTEQLLNQPDLNDPATRMLMNKIKQLEAKQTAAERAAQDSVQQQYKQAISQITNEVKMLVDAEADYETIKSTGMHDAVVELIEQTYQSSGTLMDIAEAAKQVENYLVEEAFKLAQLGKVKSRLAPSPAAAPDSAPKSADTKMLETLTNNIPTPAPKRLSEKERRARALAAFAGKLNQ